MTTATLPESAKSLTTGTMTVEEFLSIPTGHRFELLDGQLERRNMGAESSEVAIRIGRIFGNWSDARRAGRIYGPDGGYRIFGPNRNRVRYPDNSFVATDRLPDRRSPKGLLLVAPDLAVEVVSPRDRAAKVEQKRIEFLEAGTKMYWIVYPDTETVHIFRPNSSPLILGPADEISDLDGLPGFACRVSEFFTIN